MQIWLFGYELVDTLCVFCANEIHVLSSKKKIEFLRPLEAALSQKSDLPTLKLLTRNKADADATNFINVATVMKKSKNVRIVLVCRKCLAPLARRAEMHLGGGRTFKLGGPNLVSLWTKI